MYKRQVRDEEGRNFVFVKTQQGYQKVEVSLGVSQSKYIEVISGLRDDENVVVSGAYQLLYPQFTEVFTVEA